MKQDYALSKKHLDLVVVGMSHAMLHFAHLLMNVQFLLGKMGELLNSSRGELYAVSELIHTTFCQVPYGLLPSKHSLTKHPEWECAAQLYYVTL